MKAHVLPFLPLEARAAAFAQAWPRFPGAWPHLGSEAGHPVFYAIWILGNRYANHSKYYGSYPHGFLPRLLSLFPERRSPTEVLHAFSGSLKRGPYTRLDSNPRLRPELVGSVYDVGRLVRGRPFSLVIADPPYSAADARRYGTQMVNRRRALESLAGVVQPGGFVCWLDTVWPMYSNRQWQTVGRIFLIISTNHRVRMCTVFMRAGAAAGRVAA